MKNIGLYCINKARALWVIALVSALAGCTKTEKGFLSPYFQYPISEYSISKGRDFTSDAINPDGSSVPFKVEIVHIYDATGKIVDDVFFKKYPVSVWTSAYNNATDTTAALIAAKRKTEELPALKINESNGAIVANSASINLPSGKFTIDLRVSNEAGTQMLPKAVTINLADAAPFETAPGLAATSEALIMVGNESSSVALGSAYTTVSVQKTGDDPWVIHVKMVDKNGVPFNPLKGEIVKRPNSGLNPNPPFLQNLQAYTLSYVPTESEMQFPYSVTPMPLESLGNGYNMYYRIPTQYFHIDGYPDDKYSLNIRFPLRIWVPGTYNITVTVNNVTHR
ncbi:MAG TPA: hypothetical protein VNS32_15700 [Flavisolibacter sp.]|nr:hypothetical protein [Flavisolibacter sp.]